MWQKRGYEIELEKEYLRKMRRCRKRLSRDRGGNEINEEVWNRGELGKKEIGREKGGNIAELG